MARNIMMSIENARIIFRNFRGEERQYNDKGDRNFNLVLTEEKYQEAGALGFNVRVRPPRDPEGDPQYLLQVTVSYKNRPPRVILIGTKNKTTLNEDTIGTLDYAEIENIDLSIRGYEWSMPNGMSGVKAYLNSMYVTLEPDMFEDKYADIPSDEDY